jgi:lipopolysaccharide/colanic/teichoic acid biosynthesis glycosyltransferase
VVGGLDLLGELAGAGFRVVLVADGPGEASSMADELRYQFRHVVWVRDHRDLPVEGLQVRNLGGVLGVEFVNQLSRRRNRALKRATDLTLASLALLPAVPILLVAGFLMKFRSRGPVFFRQEREGYRGGIFQILKMRTMYVDAEERLERHLASSPEAREEWDRHMKLARDPRIVPGVGRWMRRFSLDEVPQLIHVLRGEMSLVGPRPFPAYHLARFSPAFRRLRRRVRPGLTGLWQVVVRSEGGVEEQEAYDTYYIRNWSLWMDCYVLARTSAAVLRGRGAY